MSSEEDRRERLDLLREGERAVAVGDRVKVLYDGHGLAWGTDSYLLAAFLRPAERMCELGCGSGVVSFLASAHGKAEKIVAFEINRDSCSRAARGVTFNRLEHRVDVFLRDVRKVRPTDAECGGRFDTVFANPPYISHPGTPKADAEADDARHENNGCIADFCAAAARLLKHRGRFVCVWRPNRLCDLFAAMRAAGIEPKRLVDVYPDSRSAASTVLCEGVLGGGKGLTVLPPLFVYRDGDPRGKRENTERFLAIYEKCSFEEADGK